MYSKYLILFCLGVLKFQAEASGRPQIAIDKMVEGRLRKYFEEIVLMEQKFIMNDTMTVKVRLDSSEVNEIYS